MTTFQDPPPQSRRSARQNEREEAPDAPAVAENIAPLFEPIGIDATPHAPAADVEDHPQTRSGRRAREAAQQGLYSVPRASVARAGGGVPL